MIAGKFEEQVKKTPHHIAVKTVDETFTYDQLNRYANRIAHKITGYLGASQDETPARVGLLFPHGPHMIAAILGTLKAGMAYVPLSIDYPENRLVYMVGNSESSLLLCLGENEPTAREIARQTGCLYLSLTGALDGFSEENPGIDIPGSRLVYIMYTSGSTGRPKGVLQIHENVLYYIRNWVRIFSITQTDRLTLFSSFCHDGSVQDTLAALFTGAGLYPLDIRSREGMDAVAQFLKEERITTWHSVPSLYSYFVNTLTREDHFPELRWILLGGEAVREHEINAFRKYFPQCILANVYGQTESSVDSIRLIRAGDTIEYLTIGEPLDETEIFVLDKNDNEVDAFEVGEIMVAGRYISPGYWKNEEATKKTFSRDPELGILYFTGDQGRLLPGGEIEFMGRADSQVKLRGFRIELGEIESQLLKHPDVNEAVVTAGDRADGEKYLAAYFVPLTPRTAGIEAADLQTFLAGELPDYMIPTYFTELEKFPLTQSGKIDRGSLPEPVKEETTHVAPRNPIEDTLVKLWAASLSMEPGEIGIDANFFQLGGHSLKAASLVSKIHKALDVKIPVTQFFTTPTIRGLAGVVGTAAKKRYVGLPKAPEQQYYPLSAIQERFFIQSRMEGADTAFNIRQVLEVEGKLDRQKLEEAFRRLIHRHESFRTSFHLVEDQPVQKIQNNVDFKIEDLNPEAGEHRVRPFDLSKAPLLRVRLGKLAENKHLLMIETHHIVMDGTSVAIMLGDFFRLYEGRTLSPLKNQYKDFAVWQKSPAGQAVFAKQESFWLDQFKGPLTPAELFTDFPRPPIQSFEGDRVDFAMEKELALKLRRLIRETGVTLYMVFLAALNLLLARYTGREDIIVGTALAGRGHVELEEVIGVFINALAVRHYPSGEKTLGRFLEEIKENTLKVYENQEYPYGGLIEKLGLNVDPSRNPLFDVDLVVQNMDIPRLEAGDLIFVPVRYEAENVQVDIQLFAMEWEDGIIFNLLYCTRLFKRSTMERFGNFFKEILAVMVEPGNMELKLADIAISHELETTNPGAYKETAVDFDF